MATLAQIRTRALQRADMAYDSTVPETSKFATNVEVDGLINAAYKELYGHLVRNGMHMAESDYTVATDGSATYALPADLWAVLGVHRVQDGRYIRLERHSVRHRPSSTWTGPAYTYRVIGVSLELSPRPTSGDYVLRYVPVPAELVAEGDILDGVLGWEEYVVVDVAIKLRLKEESGVEELVRERERLLARIQDEAQAAEATEGTRVENVRDGESLSLPGDNIGSYRPAYWWW